jgi:hypothetical protein
MPRGSFLRKLEKVTVTFGEPIDPLVLDGESRSQAQIVELLHERVAELGGRR